MEYQRVRNLLGDIPDKVPRFITEKWVEVHAYIVVKGKITVCADERDRGEVNRQVICISKRRSE